MRVVVCADSSKQIGFGHITRSLTLARALTDLGAEVICIGQGMNAGKRTAQSFNQMVAKELPLTNGEDRAAAVFRLQADAVITDGYHFDREFYGLLDENRVPYGVVDDIGATRATNPRVVHNQNPSASRILYSNVSDKAVFLLGLEFALLRSELAGISASNPLRRDYVLISFGGTDVLNLTVPVAEALVRAGYRIAVSEDFGGQIGNNRNLAGVVERVSFFAPPRFLDSLASAEIAVLGAGTSLWEANALGTRALGVVVAANQLAPAEKAKSLGYLSDLLLVKNRDQTREIQQAITRIVDSMKKSRAGHPETRVPLDGAKRVAGIFLREFSAQRESFP